MDIDDITVVGTALGTVMFIILLVAVICLASPTLVSEEKIEVTATITNTYHSFPMGGPYVYKVADYDVYFEYEGIKGSWDTNSETYNKYKDKIGEPIKCYLITRVYDNGKAELTLVAVEDYDKEN